MVDLVRDRDVREHRAEERERLPGEEQAVVPAAPERREVDRREAEQPPERARVLGGDGRDGRHRAEALGFVGHARLVLAHAGSLRGGLAGKP